MLLSGIYYGKTRIGRAYKNGEIIWRIGTDKYVDDIGVDIQSDIVAYITDGALKLLQLEENVRVYDSATINTSPIKSSEIAELVLSATDSTLHVNNSSLVFVETSADIGNSAVILTSPISYGGIDEAVILNTAAESIVVSSRNGMAKETLLLKKDSVLNVSHSENGDIDEAINLNIVANPIINDAIGSLVENVIMPTKTDLNCSLIANESSDETISLKIETNLNCLPEIKGFIQEMLTLEKDSVLNISKNIHGNTTQVATLQNLSCGDVLASVASVIDALSLIDPDVNYWVSAARRGVVKNEIFLQINPLGAVSHAESSVIDNEIVLNDIIEAQISGSVQSLADQTVSEEFLAQADMSVPNLKIFDNATVLDTEKNVINVTNTENIKTYNMCLRFENDNFIQISEADVMCGKQIISLLCEESEINISVEKLLQSCDIDARVTPVTNMRLGTTFKTLLNEGLHMISNNDLGVILPFGLMITHGAQSKIDTFLSYSIPYDANVMQSIQCGDISTVTFWKPLELCLNDAIQDDCAAKLDYQNTIEAELDGCHVFKSDVRLAVDTYGNLVEFNAGEKITSSVRLSFWQLPIQQGNNLLIRQAWETEPYLGDGSLTIY